MCILHMKILQAPPPCRWVPALHYYVDKKFLIRENEKAKQAATTPHCRLSCANCGVIRETGHPCFTYN